MLLLPFWWDGGCMALQFSYTLLLLFICVGSGAQPCSPLLTRLLALFCNTENSCWRLKNSDYWARSPTAQYFTTVWHPAALFFAAETHLINLSPYLLFSHHFCFPNHCFNLHLLKPFVVQLLLPVTLVWIQSKAASVISSVRDEITTFHHLQPKPMSPLSASFSLLFPISKRICRLWMVILIIRHWVKLHNLLISPISRCFWAIN